MRSTPGPISVAAIVQTNTFFPTPADTDIDVVAIDPGPGFTTPAAFEAAHYRQQHSAEQAETQTTEPL